MFIVRVDMTDRSVKLEQVPEKYKWLAGRALTSRLVADEVPPQSHPLGPSNKLAFSPGIVTGTPAPTSARISIGSKSPLTGGIKEANAGSSWAHDLAVMGIRGLVLEGQPAEKGKYWGLYLSLDKGKPKVEFFEANEFTGKPLPEVYPKMYDRFGREVSVCGIGMAGEHGYANSGVCFNDQSRRPSRYAGRGGLGAVVASKGVKFIVLNREAAQGSRSRTRPSSKRAARR